jgi:hypothetical protein
MKGYEEIRDNQSKLVMNEFSFYVGHVLKATYSENDGARSFYR